MISQDLICQELKSKGYIEVIKTNGEPYNGKDMYFCAQAPDLYLLKIVRGHCRIEKIGKSNYSAELSTKVGSISDIDLLHNEINNIIINQDESTLKNKSTGCLASVVLLIAITVFSIYKFF